MSRIRSRPLPKAGDQRMTNERRTIATDGAPAAIGPYSQAVRWGDIVYCSGVIPIGPDGEIVSEALDAQVDSCLGSLAAIAQAAGTHVESALRLTIYTTKLEQFAEINAAYEKWFKDDPPARVTVGVAALPRGVAVEIDALLPVSG